MQDLFLIHLYFLSLTVLFRPLLASEAFGELVKMLVAGLDIRIPDLIILGLNLRIYIPAMLPDEAG